MFTIQKKRKTKKRTQLLTLTLILSIINGCSKNSEKIDFRENVFNASLILNDTEERTNTGFKENNFDTSILFNKAEEELKNKFYLDRVNLPNQGIQPEILEEYIHSIAKIKMEYSYEENCPSLEEITNIYNNALQDTKCNINYFATKSPKSEEEVNKVIHEIIEKIKVNSSLYLKEHSEYYSSFRIPEAQEKAQEYLEENLEKILKDIIMTSTNDLNDDLHQFENLIIVFEDKNFNDSNGIVLLNENAIVLYPKKMEKYVNKEEFKDYMYFILYKSINRIRQMPCMCRVETAEVENKKITPFLVEENEISSLLIRASSESFMIQMDKDFNKKEDTYEYMDSFPRRYESFFIFLAQFNEQAKLKNYYNALFDNDLESFYQFLGLESEEDILRFYHILYTMEADFNWGVYLKKLSCANLGELSNRLKNPYKIDYFTLTAEKMMKYTSKNQEIKLVDQLVLFSILKNKVIQDTELGEIDEEGNYNTYYDEDFITKVKEIDEIYMQFLSDLYCVSIDEIKTILESKEFDHYLSEIKFVSHGDSLFEEYYFKAKKILDKFPMLEYVVYADPTITNVSKIQEFEEETTKFTNIAKNKKLIPNSVL